MRVFYKSCLITEPYARIKHPWHWLQLSIVKISKAHQSPEEVMLRTFLFVEVK